MSMNGERLEQAIQIRGNLSPAYRNDIALVCTIPHKSWIVRKKRRRPSHGDSKNRRGTQ